jgi:hypothetical protein
MEVCNTPIHKKIYTPSRVSYKDWSQEKIKRLFRLIEKKLQYQKKPTVIVLEIAHFTLPIKNENRIWAKRNMHFANELCGKIIKEYQHQFKIIPTLLLNNLNHENSQASEEFIDEMVKGQRYIRKSSIKLISERNLKNRAFKALKRNKKLSESFITIDGKAYLKNDEYQHDLAVGFVNDDGKIIPRCGLILTSFLDMIAKLANDRLHQKSDVDILFISFSEEFHEYQRVRLAVDVYSKVGKSATIHPIVIHWSYEIDQCLTSYRECNTQEWQETEL